MTVSGGWRLLGAFWAAVAAVAALSVGVAALLGPLPPKRAAHEARLASRTVPAAISAAVAPPHAPPEEAPLGGADPSLLIASGDFPGRMLPRIAADGRRPATANAASVPVVLPGQARLALVVDGIGLDGGDSRRAIEDLPEAVSFAVSPYAENLLPLAAEARRRGHELLVSLPMEPENSAFADEGDRALRPDLDDAANARNLEWVLSAVPGIVGVTGADPAGEGEHMAVAAPLFHRVVEDALNQDGLLYVAPASAERPDPVAGLPVAIADLSLEAAPYGDAVDAMLQSLAADAIRTGAALGTLGPPDPATEARVEAFLRTLPARGIVLVPASALARPLSAAPTDQASLETPR